MQDFMKVRHGDKVRGNAGSTVKPNWIIGTWDGYATGGVGRIQTESGVQLIHVDGLTILPTTQYKPGDHVRYRNYPSISYVLARRIDTDTSHPMWTYTRKRGEAWEYTTGGWDFVETFELDPDYQPKPKPTLDLSKPVQTTKGVPVRIICTDAEGYAPVVGLHNNILHRWNKDGSLALRGGIGDLVNVPEKPIERTIYLYMHRNRRNGEVVVGQHPKNWKPNDNELMAIKEITITEGEGM